MSTRKDQSGKLSFRNFSPFYEKAMADAKRDENFLKIMAKDIEKRKMISYGQLTAAQRIVEKDLFQLKQAKQKNKEMSLRRARSNTDPTCETWEAIQGSERFSTSNQSLFPAIKNPIGERLRSSSSTGSSVAKPQRPERFSMQETGNYMHAASSHRPGRYSLQETGNYVASNRRPDRYSLQETGTCVTSNHRLERYSMQESGNYYVGNYSRFPDTPSKKLTNSDLKVQRNSLANCSGSSMQARSMYDGQY